MTVIDAIYSWLITHPLSGELIVGLIVGFVILFFTPILAPIVDTFWKFCAIRPQRLNVWVLKARLSSAEWELYRVRRISKELSFLMYTCFKGMGYMGFVLASLIAIAVITGKIDFHRAANDAQGWIYHLARILQVALIFWVYSFFFRFLSTVDRVTKGVISPVSSLKELTAKVAKLEGKLGLNAPLGEDPAPEKP
jgi:hypothetical protein